MQKILSIVGARPNFIKIASFIRAIEHYNENNQNSKIIHLLVHTGQHYDDRMSKAFFESLDIQEKPDWVVVVGDVNATLACSVTAQKLNIRSSDMSMPEEINRLVTDRISDLLLTPDILSGKNLLNEGISEKKIKFVGNIMIDTLFANIEQASNLKLSDIIANNLIEISSKRGSLPGSLQFNNGLN